MHPAIKETEQQLDNEEQKSNTKAAMNNTGINRSPCNLMFMLEKEFISTRLQLSIVFCHHLIRSPLQSAGSRLTTTLPKILVEMYSKRLVLSNELKSIPCTTTPVQINAARRSARVDTWGIGSRV